jgi:arylformamidase
MAAYFDLQYNARVSVDDFNQYPRQYRALSDEAHASLCSFKDVAYGTGAGERLDIFPGNQPDSPVLLFIHGGFWRCPFQSGFGLHDTRADGGGRLW